MFFLFNTKPKIPIRNKKIEKFIIYIIAYSIYPYYILYKTKKNVYKIWTYIIVSVAQYSTIELTRSYANIICKYYKIIDLYKNQKIYSNI